MPTQKMYVLVRNDLAETYKIVQGSHALAQFALNHNKEFQQWNNSTIIYLGVRNLKELKFWSSELYEQEKTFSCFREPDLDNQLTAIACYDHGLIFRKLKIA